MGDPAGSDPGLKEDAREFVLAAREATVDLSHRVHERPELAFQEFRASARIANTLRDLGLAVQAPVAKLETAFEARSGDGPLHVALLAEYDALPEVGHACGHNVIAATALGAGVALAGVAERLGLRVSVIGTPAEEGGGGKIHLLEAGAFEGVHIALMTHPGPSDVLAPTVLAAEQIEVGYRGRTAHAASFPERGINAGDALVVAQVALALVLLLGACGSGGGDNGDDAAGGDGGKGQLTVGADAFAEAQIVGEMYSQVLENAGYTVDRQLSIDSREVRLPAMEKGEIDLAPEYLASLLSVIDPNATPSTDPAELTQQLQQPLRDKGLEVLRYSDAIDTNAFVVTPDTAEQNDLSAVSDLAPVAGDMTLGGPAECPKRPYCIPGLKKVYGVEFGDFRPLEYGPATVAALESGAIDVALLFSTDALIQEKGLVLLEDDKNLQAADNITPLVRSDAATGEVPDLLNEVSGALTTDKVTSLNARVSIDQEDPATVARDFLEEEGIL